MKIHQFCGISILLTTLFFSSRISAQLTFKAMGTGQTTGSVGKLQINNPTDQTLLFSPAGYYFIPSANGFQGYILVNEGLSDVLIPPGETIEMPLDNGYCTDIHLPPVPENQALPSFETWITPTSAVAPPTAGQYLSEADGWVQTGEPSSLLTPTFPGTEIPLPGKINPNEHPATAAGVLFEVLRNITVTVDDLYSKGETPRTPFSTNPAKERETLIQQTFWICGSLLNPSDEDYTLDDFADQTWQQFADAGGDTTNVAPALRKEIEKGVQDFWNGFEAVGIKAKVLVKNETPGEPSTSAMECGCTFSIFEGISISSNGARVEPGTTLQPGLYHFEARFRHDCPAACTPVIHGSWVIDFIPSNGGAILQDFGQGSTISFEVPAEGALLARFRGSVFCNGRPCPSQNNSPTEMTVTLPAEHCPCNHCEVAQPIRILNARTGEELSGDSIPWYIDRLRVEPPVLQSDCPGECTPRNYVSVNKEIRYRYRGAHYSSNSVPVEFGIAGPGDLILNTRYHCFCDGKQCDNGELHKVVHLSESNNCCDQIRSRNNGQLRFGFGNGTISIRRNELTIHVPPDAPETFTMDFNLEAVFCNLNDNQVVSRFQQMSEQRRSGNELDEFISTSDISLDHPVGFGDSPPYYSLVFSKSINGREILVSIIMDEASCVFDIQVLYNDEVYEHTGPPYLSSQQMILMSEQMGSSLDPRFWHRALVLLSHFFRVREYGRQLQYNRSLESFLNLLHAGASRLYQETDDPVKKSAISDLLVAIIRARSGNGFSHLEELLERMIPVVNGV